MDSWHALLNYLAATTTILSNGYKTQLNAGDDFCERGGGRGQQTLENRHASYETAKLAKSNRCKDWPTRHWKRVEEVWLNPQKELLSKPMPLKCAA